MGYDLKLLRRIFDRTEGVCHICHNDEGIMCFNNYGKPSARGAWEVDHSLARANYGTDHFNNLWPAHIKCNRRRQAENIRKTRSQYGYCGPPHSAEAKEKIRQLRARVGGIGGGLAGLAIGGPVGAFVGAVVGAVFGHNMDPESGRKK